jgi:3-isopropylmalate/(R)-2-methylmalate dehydratase large subunit
VPSTLLDKIWQEHVVATLPGGYDLLHVDRHLLHDLSGPTGLRTLARRDLRVRNPELTFATPDHCVASTSGRTDTSTASGARLIPALRDGCARAGIRLFDVDEPEQGIVHVIGPELGLTQPGLTLVCGDSHTCTHGALGALAWGIGTSELTHVLATQCIIERKPRALRIRCEGILPTGTTPKDLILAIIARHGADVGVGYAVEFAGGTIRALSLEGRMTVCNLAVELGAKIGQVSPDDATIEYLAGRRYAPQGPSWDAAVVHWRSLPSDPDARFEREIDVAASQLQPRVTWGTSPEHGAAITDIVPYPDQAADAAERRQWLDALDYMGLRPGRPLLGLPIDRVFIGSCTNARLSDLEAAALIVRGRKVAAGVEAWVVPGSRRVKREAEAAGLHDVFTDAGFQWREPGCSMCVASNGEYVAPGQRCVSTSNRNFVGRQGPGARTHLASPLTAAASALAGALEDPRRYL